MHNCWVRKILRPRVIRLAELLYQLEPDSCLLPQLPISYSLVPRQPFEAVYLRPYRACVKVTGHDLYPEVIGSSWEVLFRRYGARV